MQTFNKYINIDLMYAIVDIAGQQFKVEKGAKIFVHQLPGKTGAEISFDKVLLISNNDKVNVGEPYVNNAVVSAQILSHLRADKIKVFKKKRRKGYKVLKGHRQYLTEILIEEISETGMPKKTAKTKAPETSQELAQPAEAAGKPPAGKVETSDTVKDKLAERKTKPSKEMKKAEVKAAPAKKQPVKKAAKESTAASKSAARATKSTATKKTKTPSTNAKKTTQAAATKKATDTKTKPAAKNTPAKKQGTTGKKQDTKT